LAVIVISPHFDDAVLSAWTYLQSKEVSILTICAGVPSAEVCVSSADLNCGFTSGREAALERIHEDVRVCNGLGIVPIHLDELDYPYSGDKDKTKLGKKLSPHIYPDNTIFVPLGIGRHPDHVATRDSVIQMYKNNNSFQLFFYADFPYASMPRYKRDKYNWLAIEKEIRSQGIQLCKFQKVSLEQEWIEKKIEYLKKYKSQIRMLQVNYPDLLNVPGILKNEYFWGATYD
jgi:LmbE family N-acetylglucosaminyl deacetylase